MVFFAIISPIKFVAFLDALTSPVHSFKSDWEVCQNTYLVAIDALRLKLWLHIPYLITEVFERNMFNKCCIYPFDSFITMYVYLFLFNIQILFSIYAFVDCVTPAKNPRTLPSGTVCRVSDTCTDVKCCHEVPIFNKNFEYSLDFDQCDLAITITIEDLRLVYSTLTFDFGMYTKR